MVAYGVSAGNVKKLDNIRVVSKGEDAHVFEAIGEEVFWPEDSILVLPCAFAITCKAVDKHDTGMDVRCVPVVRLSAYSTVSVAPSATVLRP